MFSILSRGQVPPQRERRRERFHSMWPSDNFSAVKSSEPQIGPISEASQAISLIRLGNTQGAGPTGKISLKKMLPKHETPVGFPGMQGLIPRSKFEYHRVEKAPRPPVAHRQFL
eukprot:TRINITY_DN25042_c0_g1_i1.p1 TRINITY_DN25042_c0_g1~~TRINITY_DN25042_c0_g1_i1.p1  ORF type:complete len:114 (+),score=13.24 TRINITY_DN25042_c0_g1_i1:104-445(+)